MSRFDDLKQDTLVERVIAASARNKFLIVIFTVFAVPPEFMGCCTPHWMPSRTFQTFNFW
jgi:hypothetical protein